MEEHEGSNNLVCFNFVIDLHENRDPEAWDRILDAFIVAVEKEGACAGGGLHPTGSSLAWCSGCQDFEEDEEDDDTTS